MIINKPFMVINETDTIINMVFIYIVASKMIRNAKITIINKSFMIRNDAFMVINGSPLFYFTVAINLVDAIWASFERSVKPLSNACLSSASASFGLFMRS